MGTEQEVETGGATQTPKPKLADYFQWWRNPTDRFSFLLVVVTFLLFIATVGLYFATSDLVDDARNTADASNRAYIAITGVKWDGVPEVGKNQRLKILFKNVGKEAASDFSLFAFVSNAFDFEPDSKGMPYIDPSKVQWPIIQDCSVFGPRGEKIIGQRPVYPDVPNEAIAYAFNPGGSTPGATFVPQRLIDGKTTFWTAGCAVYRTLNKPRHSPFCFYYQPSRGGDVREGTFEWCPVGSGNAD